MIQNKREEIVQLISVLLKKMLSQKHTMEVDKLSEPQRLKFLKRRAQLSCPQIEWPWLKQSLSTKETIHNHQAGWIERDKKTRGENQREFCKLNKKAKLRGAEKWGKY